MSIGVSGFRRVEGEERKQNLLIESMIPSDP